jgi:phosphoesterase RecJ-like protein
MNDLALTPAARRRIIDQILRAVRAGKTFFLTGHERPDGDTVGSELAFASFLRRQKKRVTIANAHPIPSDLSFLSGARSARDGKRFNGRWDVAVVFECSGPERMGNIIDLKTQARTVINIDHHAHHAFFGDINLINPRASSNSEQLFHLFERARWTMTPAEATALYVGVVTDTGRFQYDSVSPETHRVAAGLLEAGADVAGVSRRIFGTRSLAALKLLSRALSSFRLDAEGRLSLMVLTQADFTAAGAGPDDTEEIVNHGLLPSGVEATALVRENDDGEVKFSLRGHGRVDLCKVAVAFGGGGHRNAAGVTLPGPVEQALARVLPVLRAALPPRR